MKTVVILQSNYIPWKGYFDLIHDADLFIFYDDVQYTKHDWRNRNKIKTENGTQWLTVPTGVEINRLIRDVAINSQLWQTKHWEVLRHQYSKAPYFDSYSKWLMEVFLGKTWLNLSEMNQYMIRTISKDILKVSTVFQSSSEYALAGHAQDRLIDLLLQTGATRYISGPSARAYIDPARFSAVDVDLVWKNYAGYPEYPQRYSPFEHQVSILDLLFNVGPEAPWYIWGWREEKLLQHRLGEGSK